MGLSKREISKIMAAHKAGKTVAQIALETGISAHMVAIIISQYEE